MDESGAGMAIMAVLIQVWERKNSSINDLRCGKPLFFETFGVNFRSSRTKRGRAICRMKSMLQRREL
ncbi:MAG: hypothetical protein WBP42_04340, partial [Candidatus Zixiibacteriota bacterium]